MDVVCLRTEKILGKKAEFTFFGVKNSDFEKNTRRGSSKFQAFPGSSVSDYFWFKKILRLENPDIVHIHTARDYFLTLLKKKFPRTRFIVSRHNSLPLGRFPNRFFLRRADRMVTVSQDSRKALLERFPELGDKTKTIYHGMESVPVKAFPSFKTFQMGYLGRISRTKGLHLLIEALGRLQSLLPEIPFKLTVGGFFETKSYGEHVTRLIMKLGLKSKVSFAGPVSRVESFMENIHLLVHPALVSARESFGLVALEAMASGRPVAAFACGALPEIIQNSKTGIIVPDESAEALAQALAKILKQPTSIPRMGRAGTVRARKLFSIKTLRDQLRLLYQLP